ncbi:MAG: RNA polymerase sigma factor [Candidatus Scalindua sp. AMX11]|nr:MAG: RNA polymerase sigma factor [Candidatus Scalindua sp.]NOG84332.1 RNA polymerase sigma factor [Planctomycetota bacterium]RZV74413.1 MAG: RNA polymerase sigma factor [Candidatus Scalindua sp. SCAELEC01]TDE65333.1 MAG: RNA polymerase sigma factor [Candidatus Scalindua sp. AMX11]GJQ60758.1 MAG: DNA-directed RNA polymerase sigma-70 factor [Candidatus Scalindua sp.]
MENLKESELVIRAKEGDPTAFENLVERNYMLVYTISYKWCGTKEDAEDVTQEVFMKLSKNILYFKEESTFQTWLYRIAINTAKDLAKMNERKRKKESAYIEERKTSIQQQKESSLAERVHQMIENLPQKLKETAFLVFSEGMNHKEAAAILNCAEKTVSWRVFQAKRALKRNLERGESL